MKIIHKLLSNCTLDDLSFDKITNPLVKHIRKFWNWRGLKPKGYKQYLENYQDYQDMDELIESVEKFKGIEDDTGVCSFSFPYRVSKPHVAYDDTNQGHDPLSVLISSCITYGMLIEQKRTSLTT